MEGASEAISATGSFLAYLPMGLAIAAVGVGGLATLIYTFQDRLLYFPSMPPNARSTYISPHHFNLSNDLEEVFFNTKDGLKLQAYFIRNLRGKATDAVPTMLYFHGNAGNLSFRLPNIKHLVDLVGVNVFIVSYRGYGKSEGTPSEEGLRLDAESALDYLYYERNDIDKNKIIVFGRSLGGAVAIRVSTDHPDKVAAVIVENTFTSIPDMIDVVMRFLSPFKFLSRNQWNSKDTISRLTSPILLLSGEKDELVPARMMNELFESATSTLKRHIIYFDEGTHMDTFMQPSYYKKIKKWLKTVFNKATRHLPERESEEVHNEDHELLDEEGEEIEAALVGSTL